MLQRQRLQGQQGFTLAEILVTTAIFAIIMLAALAVYDRSNQVFKTGTEAADLQQSTRIGFDKLVSDVRMAGFDYNRGGAPQESWQAPQPDEQIEYAGPTAVIFRANFNYNNGAAQGNGLEQAFTPVNVNSGFIFPYVTTSNSEIVAYVLRSTNAAANANSISFWVDDFRPRSVFPTNLNPAPAGTNPPQIEAQVTINSIDTTNANPPYTLYRVSVADGNCNGTCVVDASRGTPVAENVRSLNFQYYSDFGGTTLLKNADGSVITAVRDAGGGSTATANTGAIGGDGRYDPMNIGSTTNFADRQQRAQIASIRVSLVGMNANPDLQGYTNPTETIASISQYRQYALSSLVVPRNLGLTGFPEPNFTPPSPPTIVSICTGHCGAPVIYWTAPVTGSVVSYHIEWDSNLNGAYNNSIDVSDPTATSAIFPDDGALDVSTTRYYRMEALNDNGSSPPSQPPWAAVPQNRTRPSPPTALQGTGGQQNAIPLQWVSPMTNQSPLNVLSCSGAGGNSSGANIPVTGEIIKYRVYRGTTQTFDPATQGVKVLEFDGASQPSVAGPGATINWIGSGTNSAYPPANCVDYYYRVQAADRCYKQANWNASGNTADSISDIAPAYPASSAAGPYRSTATDPPQWPATASVDTNPAVTGCPDPVNGGATNCRVVLQWQKVLSDTANHRIGVDSYEITRGWRILGAGGAFVNDPLFGSSGLLEVNCPTGTCASGYSQTDVNAQNTYVDTPLWLNNGGLQLEYQYTIAAKNCSFYSGAPASAHDIAAAQLPPNPQVKFPTCSTSPTIDQQGSNGGTGDSPNSPWVMNSGDTVTTHWVAPNPPAGTTINSVAYELTVWPQGTQVGSIQSIPAPGPYVYTWSDQTDLQIYQLRITITSHDALNSACTEVRVKYIQDQQAAGCFFNNVTPPGPQFNNIHSNPETDTVTTTLTNTGSEPIKFNCASALSCVSLPLLGQSFQGQVKFTWHSPDLPNHTDLQLTDIVWNIPAQAPQTGTWGTSPLIPAYSNTQGICSYNSNCTLAGNATITTGPLNVPSNMPDLLPGNSMTIRVSFKFDSRSGRPSLPSSPSALLKTCLSYRIISENTVTKRCNLVGQSGSTQNPNNCD